MNIFTSRLRPLCSVIAFSSAVILISTSGCVTLLKAPSGQQLLSASLPNSDQVREQWASRSQKGGVDSAWIKSFRDPALESYIGEVVAGNIELGAALHAVEAAAASARQAGAMLRPQLNAAGSSSHLNRSGGNGSDSSELSAQLSWS